jgi:hypothetical protein
MSLMFATRNPTVSETKYIRALLSTFRDGSGNERESDGSTRAGWREIERCIAEAVLGPASENKHIFDVIAPDDMKNNIFYGFSIKSKQLSSKKFLSLSTTGRVYMEIANSPAKFWADINKSYGYTEREFSNMIYPDEIGNSVISTVKSWHNDGKSIFEKLNSGNLLDLDNSKYLCVSYSDEVFPKDRKYQIHAFALDYPDNISWRYKSNRCLSGYDSRYPDEAIFDWYGSSGGQLKYYPRGSSAIYKSEVFLMLNPPTISLTDKARQYFPDEF